LCSCKFCLKYALPWRWRKVQKVEDKVEEEGGETKEEVEK